MIQRMGFWQSLERYTWKVVDRVAPSLPYLGIVIVGIVMTTSIWKSRASVASARSLREVVMQAARKGDYEQAQELWEKTRQVRSKPENVLGVESEMEELIYPKRRVERELEKYQRALQTYPGHRDILLQLAQLCMTTDNQECATRYREQARELDPNHPVFGE